MGSSCLVVCDDDVVRISRPKRHATCDENVANSLLVGRFSANLQVVEHRVWDGFAMLLDPQTVCVVFGHRC